MAYHLVVVSGQAQRQNTMTVRVRVSSEEGRREHGGSTRQALPEDDARALPAAATTALMQRDTHMVSLRLTISRVSGGTR